MKIIIGFLIIQLILSTHAQEENERLVAELEIADLEQQDDCENLSNGARFAILNNNFTVLKNMQLAHGNLLRSQSEVLKNFDNVPFEMQRNWTVLVKSGDALLSTEDWSNLVSYDNTIEELVNGAKILCQNGIAGCTFTKNGYQNILQSSSDKDLLRETWKAWQNLLLLNKNNFSAVLDLVKEAALANEKENARSYWEMLVDQENAYEKAELLWSEIQPLYSKLQDFVRKRLFRFHNISDENSSIPVYLLGSNFGNDWSFIADKILPHPQFYYDAEVVLKRKTIKDVYKLAEELTKELSLGTLGNKFWNNSKFNMTTCENKVLSFCVQEYSEVLTCDKVSWLKYLEAFENTVDIALRNRDYVTFSRMSLRDSLIDETIISLGSLFAIENFPFDDKNTSTLIQSQKMTKLLLTALRILPKLPYYLAADKWRLEQLENFPGNMSESWWQFRKNIQGVEGDNNKEYDFLGDPYITTNKPYISKFFGNILQFQIFDYYKSRISDSNANIAIEIGNDENFMSLINEKSLNDWSYLISIYYGIDEVTSQALLDYFAPLSDYFESAPTEQQKVTTTTPRPITSTTKRVVKAKLGVQVKKEAIKELDKEKPQNDEPQTKNSKTKIIEDNNQKNSAGDIEMYIGIGLLIVVAVILVISLVAKKVKRRRRTNNRRFET